MPEIAKHIEITPTEIIIDGKPMGYYLEDEPIEVQEYDHGLSVVTLRVYAEKVTAHTGASLIVDTRVTSYRVPKTPSMPSFIRSQGVGASESLQPHT